jgi:hypothetical protein
MVQKQAFANVVASEILAVEANWKIGANSPIPLQIDGDYAVGLDRPKVRDIQMLGHWPIPKPRTRDITV